jgi:diphthamide biosynthesis protein 7
MKRCSSVKYRLLHVPPLMLSVSRLIGLTGVTRPGSPPRFVCESQYDMPFSDVGSLVVSLSDKSLALLRPDSQNGLSITETWAAHDFEPWIAAWNYWDDNIIYSGMPCPRVCGGKLMMGTGGDDLKLKGWDVRQGVSQPTFVNKRRANPCYTRLCEAHHFIRFEAGVTSIQSHHHQEHILAVGRSGYINQW